MGKTVTVRPKAETGAAITARAMAIDAACEAYWNSRTFDGWSWREMRDGQAGNSDRERELGQEYAEEIAKAIECAILVYLLNMGEGS